MKYRILGRTKLSVSEIGFGAWGIGRSMWKGSKDDESLRALNQAIDLGINFIDTALVYGNGHSEKLIRQVLEQRTEQVYVATKVPPKNFRWPANGSVTETYPADHIRRCVDRSLDNLGLERIDLLQLHVWSPSWLKDEEWYATICRLRESGKISHFGISINDHQPDSALELVHSGQVDTVQVIFNIFDQSPLDSLFGACEKMNVGVIVRVPFDEGSLTGRITPATTFPKGDWRNRYFSGDRRRQVHERVAKLTELLNDQSKTLPDLALRYCLHPKVVSTVIPGMRTEAHVAANAAVTDEAELPAGMLDLLREHRWVRNFYPPG